MSSVEVSSAYIKKLGHPMKEIRERSLQLLIAKLRLGWELEDELGGTRELIEAMLAWFHGDHPSLQHEALELLLTAIRTKAGAYIVKEMGIEKMLLSLNKIKHRLEPNAVEIFDDVTESLNFLNTVDSQINMSIPRLKLTSETSTVSNDSRNSNYNLAANSKIFSKDSSVSNEDIVIHKNELSCPDAINILLLPWVDLSTSDLKTIILIGDSLKVLKSTRRCCRFIRDVFLHDFPVEIFLNRPSIIMTLIAIADRQCGGHPEEALHTLLCITRSLHSRFKSLFSLDFISNPLQLSDDPKEYNDDVNIELEQFVGNLGHLLLDDALVPLRQLPVPLYALDTAQTVLSIMVRSVLFVDNYDDNDIIDKKGLNICLCLIESLIELLLDCVQENFWTCEHSSKIHRDIAHKACMTMRMLGELMMKCKTSYDKDPDHIHHRVAWLRLVPCGERLLNWARDSALPPSSLVAALQAAHIDPALDLLYPAMAKKVAAVIFNAKSSVDKEYKSKYRELNKLFESMDHAVQFKKIQESGRISRNIISCIKNALPILHLSTGEDFLKDFAEILLEKSKDMDLSDSDWSIARNIALILMAHNLEWVQVAFYKKLSEMVKSVFMGDNTYESDNERSLSLISDVGILTEICCHGLSSSRKEVSSSASEIVSYVLRGRLLLSEGRWWRVLASALPVLPLLHVYAAHDTPLGKAICKSLEADIVQCMGVSKAEMIAGLVRLLFVNCAPVQLDAAYSLCRLLDDAKYLPPRESLRADVIINALRRIEPQDFNVDKSTSPSKSPQATGVVQMLEVLKQDLVLNDETLEYRGQGAPQPALDPSLRRSTLQQLAVLLRQQELHEAFLQCDGLNLIISLLRLSLMVDDYLAFPECAISCVSVLNSVCFASRHSLAKIQDLPLLLIRVILVFPANDNSVLMSAQVLALVAWSGFVLQELDSSRQRVPALPLNVTQRTSLPFVVNSYWSTSPNTEHSSVEWLLTDDEWRSAIQIRWWWARRGGASLLRAPPSTERWGVAPLCSPPSHERRGAAPLRSPPSHEWRGANLLRSASAQHSCAALLLALENATTHAQVIDALHMLHSYTYLIPISPSCAKELDELPWQHTRRFLSAPPASSHDTALLISLLQFIVAYMDNVPKDDVKMSWIKSSFIGKDAIIISLLSRDRLYPQQTVQEDIELTQLRIYIVKILLRCIMLVEQQGDYSNSRMESLLKILLTCLERIDLKNFHMLGYLNELIRCIRYAVHSRYCKLSEDTLLQSLNVMTNTLSGCASGAGRKGQACRLDAMLTLIALLRKIHEMALPVQRWCEAWSGGVLRCVSRCAAADCAALRAAALHALAALAPHAPLRPQLLHCIEKESLCEYALEIFSRAGEANAVLCASAALLTALTARTSSHSQVIENEVLQFMEESNFLDDCLQIFVNFGNDKTYKNYIEPNVPLSVLERGSELEVRAVKSGEFHLSPSRPFEKPLPTAALVATLADVINNVTIYKTAPVKSWNEQGLYRVLFRCTSCVSARVRSSSCRALSAAATHRYVRAGLASTRDCLYNLLLTLKPIDDVDIDVEGMSASTQALHLLASLLVERSASDTVWWELKKNNLMLFNLLLQALESENNELKEAAMHCLIQLARSLSHKKRNDTSKDESYADFFNNFPSPYLQEHDKFCAGDSARNDCRPEYIVEEFCRILINLFQEISDKKKCLSSQDETWTLLCTCLSWSMCASERARRYSVHRRLPRALLAALCGLRDALSLRGKPLEAIRNADHEPTLNTLNSVLMVISCSMLECLPAKEVIAEDIATSLTRLWPWCMMTERLRDTLMCLLYTFTNDCPRAWSSMCCCVGGRSLINDVCLLVNREAERPRPTSILPLGLRILRNCAPHHHCRTIIIKNDVLGIMKAVRSRGPGAAEQWARLCEALARCADGAAALLAARRALPSPPAPPAAARLLPALAHAAHHQRLAFLQSQDLLELLSGSLLTGNTSEIVSAARAVWALAANNHRAKLILRSAGIPAAVQTTLQRIQKTPIDEATQRAVQLLTYTQTVLQAI